MSKQADEIYELLKQTFQYSIITKEYYVKYNGQHLFFDFYVKDYRLLFEIQGQQHLKYVEHFHGDRQGFLEAKRRDNLKLEYCQKNDLDLIIINYDEKIESEEELLKKINEVMIKW